MRSVKLVSIAAAASLFAFVPAQASSAQAPATADEEAAETNASNRVVCRRQPAPTGSRLGSRRICKTQAEWDRIRGENREVLERVQRTPLSSN